MKFSREELEEIEGWLRSPTLPKVIEHLTNNYADTWMISQDSDQREAAWAMVQCLRQVHEEFHSIVNGQKIDQHNAGRARVANWATPKPLVE